MHVSLLSWSLYGGGRARACLSLIDHLSRNDIRVSVTTGRNSWSKEKLQSHHDIPIACDWQHGDWKEHPTKTLEKVIEQQDPDVVLSWDQILNTKIRHLDRPTVGYCRTNYATGLDQYWAPSRQTASNLSTETRDREDKPVKPVYPVWYIKPETWHTERPIDVVIHGRKANGIVEKINPQYNIVLANNFSYPELREIYTQTKLFLFPRPSRFEPLGLMPIEAAAHGCNIAIPTNSGVSEIYPDCSFEYPSENVRLALNQKQDLTVPESPTNVVQELENLS